MNLDINISQIYIENYENLSKKIKFYRISLFIYLTKGNRKIKTFFTFDIRQLIHFPYFIFSFFFFLSSFFRSFLLFFLFFLCFTFHLCHSHSPPPVSVPVHVGVPSLCRGGKSIDSNGSCHFILEYFTFFWRSCSEIRVS